MHTAIISGSFDPITLGHYDLIKRTSAIFNKTVVAVCVNSEKQSFLPPEKRLEAAVASVKGLKNVEVAVCEGLLADFCNRYDNPIIVRGARNGSDFEYERSLAVINKNLGVNETLVLPAANEYGFLSSTCVREMIKYGKDYKQYVPSGVSEVINDYLKGVK